MTGKYGPRGEKYLEAASKAADRVRAWPEWKRRAAGLAFSVKDKNSPEITEMEAKPGDPVSGSQPSPATR